MSTKPVVVIVGLGEGMTDLMNTLKTRMIAAGSDPTADIALLTAQTPILNNLNTQQEDLKQQVHEKTIEVEDQRDLVEKAANKAGDKIIGCFGKDSPEGKLVASLRASTRFKGRPAKPANTPTPPTP